MISPTKLRMALGGVVMRAWWLAVAVLVGSPAIAADQFDLVCSSQKYNVRYRVDMARNEWCQGDCTAISKIAEASSGTLVLENREPAFRGDIESTVRINRVTGQWSRYYSAGPGASSYTKGSCEAAAFSGLPAPKF